MVDFVRRRFQQRKVGHCGTLDPIATGLLMLVVGKATRVQDLLMAEDKEYEGTLKLGETTDTQDAAGKILETRPVPPLERGAI
ncbi:tRNA pseudouridine(55) synthase, partial [bacterium]|nr:tRNA pseudouridine(55) synthase [bacterium]